MYRSRKQKVYFYVAWIALVSPWLGFLYSKYTGNSRIDGIVAAWFFIGIFIYAIFYPFSND